MVDVNVTQATVLQNFLSRQVLTVGPIFTVSILSVNHRIPQCLGVKKKASIMEVLSCMENIPLGKYNRYLRWTIVLLCLTSLILPSEEKIDYPEGYYPFQESSHLYKRPPKVRKPPYFRANVPCPGTNPIGTISPRDTLCGDLNKGFIPRNPMGHTPFGEPYPFEVIRNKTLKFLSRLLPYLKRDINKVTKVARFVGAPISYREPGGFDYHQIPLNYHKQRQRRSAAINGTKHYVKPTSANITSRGLCDNGSGILCTVSKTLQKSKVPLAVISALAESLSPTKTTTPKPTTLDTKAQLIALLASMAKNSLKDPTKAENKVPDKGNNDHSPLSHILSIITGADADDSENKFNPVSFMIDLVANTNSPLSYLSNLFPSRRRPVTSGGSFSNPTKEETSKIEGLPPTPCPSIEDYVTPTFARNYQGVWKYVVQIPNEGYFTQTVQQTKCVRNRCDFTDGVCHESPRWVSLLVAEVFYPNTYFPTSTPPPTSRNPYENEIPPPVEDFHNFQQYLRRRVGESEQQQHNYPVYHPQRQVVAKSKETCDGRDEIGCYIVRVYYDWFLVNGSCKCWMPTARQLFKSRAVSSKKKGNT